MPFSAISINLHTLGFKMERTNRFFISAALLAGIVIGRFLLPESSMDAFEPLNAADVAAKPNIWTCSMHPSIQQPEPGDCPICGMDLIARKGTGGTAGGARRMQMSEASKALAEIQTTVVVRNYLEAQIRLSGELGYDETRKKSLTARFPARIDELFVNFTGIRVQPGEHLAKVYSPDLLTAQRELLTAYRANPKSLITHAAREKLRLWDLLPEQIEAIIEGGKAKDHFVLKAPIGGVVVVKNVNEGDYVKMREPLFRVVDLDVLWAYLNAYESDLPWLRFGQEVTFSVESFPGEFFNGRIAFIAPEVNRKTRTIPIRINVSNRDGRLKPGMFIRGVVKSRLADNGEVYAPELADKWISPMHPEVVKDEPGQCDVCGMDLVSAAELGYEQNESAIAPLVIPATAVLRTGKRAVVYVQEPDAERPTYAGREVVLGPRAGDYFVVKAGLSVNERVVTNAAFKIDSALQIQAKPSMMHLARADSMTGHDHEDVSIGGHDDLHALPLELSAAVVLQLLDSYLAMQSALAADDLNAAKVQAKWMMSETWNAEALADLLNHMLAANKLDAFRTPHFETLSNALIATIHKTPTAFPRNLMLMHCPMVYDERGASWLQAAEPLQNPYFGSQMLGCGTVQEIINE